METQEFEVTLDINEAAATENSSSAESSTKSPSPETVDTHTLEDKGLQKNETSTEEHELQTDPQDGYSGSNDGLRGDNSPTELEKEDNSPLCTSSPESLLDEINEMLTSTSVIRDSTEPGSSYKIERSTDADFEDVFLADQSNVDHPQNVKLDNMSDITQLSEESLEDLEVQAITANAASAEEQGSKIEAESTDGDLCKRLALYLKQSVYEHHSFEVWME